MCININSVIVILQLVYIPVFFRWACNQCLELLILHYVYSNWTFTPWLDQLQTDSAPCIQITICSANLPASEKSSVNTSCFLQLGYTVTNFMPIFVLTLARIRTKFQTITLQKYIVGLYICKDKLLGLIKSLHESNYSNCKGVCFHYAPPCMCRWQCPIADEAAAAVTMETPSSQSPDVNNWQTSDVVNWLQTNQLEHLQTWYTFHTA